ncbi:hypothetical protein [Siminovitchia fortis]|uniref:hypothetical protein n=1 Tax=Siminovitchia fortis TaxID=254758 RepID=UPI0021B2A561|nr:hypothetical protein [Siminovitchia fortis]
MRKTQMIPGIYEKGMEPMKLFVKAFEVLGHLLAASIDFPSLKDMINPFNHGV